MFELREATSLGCGWDFYHAVVANEASIWVTLPKPTSDNKVLRARGIYQRRIKRTAGSHRAGEYPGHGALTLLGDTLRGLR